jgi:hypothetical protein
MNSCGAKNTKQAIKMTHNENVLPTKALAFSTAFTCSLFLSDFGPFPSAQAERYHPKISWAKSAWSTDLLPGVLRDATRCRFFPAIARAITNGFD